MRKDLYIDKLLSALYEELRLGLQRYGRRFTANSELVNDCIQDVFEKICAKEELSDIDNMESYIRRSFKNTLIDELKKRKPVESIDEQEPVHPSSSAEDRLAETERVQKIRSCIEKALICLTPQQRKLIDLRYWQDRSLEEASHMMGIEYQSAKNIMYLAIKRLRKELGDQPPDFLRF